MTREEVSKKVIRTIMDSVFVGPTDDQPSESERFYEDLGADSLDLIEVVMTIEKDCGISIPNDEYDTLRNKAITVGDIIDLVYKKIQENAGGQDML